MVRGRGSWVGIIHKCKFICTRTHKHAHGETDHRKYAATFINCCIHNENDTMEWHAATSGRRRRREGESLHSFEPHLFMTAATTDSNFPNCLLLPMVVYTALHNTAQDSTYGRVVAFIAIFPCLLFLLLFSDSIAFYGLS